MKREEANVDIYDGHLLETEDVGEDYLDHTVRHPPTCTENCAITFVTDYIGDEPWDRITTPGVRVIGWRHEEISFGFSIEHDVVCWAEPEMTLAAVFPINRSWTNV